MLTSRELLCLLKVLSLYGQGPFRFSNTLENVEYLPDVQSVVRSLQQKDVLSCELTEKYPYGCIRIRNTFTHLVGVCTGLIQEELKKNKMWLHLSDTDPLAMLVLNSAIDYAQSESEADREQLLSYLVS